jgi:N-acetyl-anhydromuramyl-L-alanine amidase AmpD
VKTHLPSLWLPSLPSGSLEHIVIHWTGGANSVSALDKLHYHFIVDGEGVVHRGIWSVKSNARPFRRRTGYAAHSLNFNAGSIGIALCGMGGATESPFRAGKWPIRQLQWQIAAEVAAQCAAQYGISTTNYDILQHGEIQKRKQIAQRGKWDCCKLPWHPNWSHGDVERDFRLRVQRATLGTK